MQTILGSGGVIGTELAKSLKNVTTDIRLVSRHPRKVNETDSVFSADLTDEAQVTEAVKGSKIAYLTAGLPYDSKIWEEMWPKIMKNVIGACRKEGSRLVFFDNMYMYDPNSLAHMTENTNFNPVSKKGKIRAEIAEMLLNDMARGNIEATIARSADFYGYSTDRSLLVEMVFKKLAEGKKANWFCSVDFKHSFTYTADAANATAILGNSDEAFNETWHLPTAGNPPTGKEWIEKIARQMERKARIQVAGKRIIRFLGVFNKLVREMGEMLYQYDRDYVFNSSKFEKQFKFTPTSYEQGIKQIIEKDFNKTAEQN